MDSPAPRSFRFALLIKRLGELPAAESREGARGQIEKTLNEIEDEFSGVAFNPEAWMNDGRMYPPQDDRAQSVKGYADVVSYRTKGHRIYIKGNGAFLIENAISKVKIIAKAGKDGRDVF